LPNESVGRLSFLFFHAENRGPWEEPGFFRRKEYLTGTVGTPDAGVRSGAQVCGERKETAKERYHVQIQGCEKGRSRANRGFSEGSPGGVFHVSRGELSVQRRSAVRSGPEAPSSDGGAPGRRDCRLCQRV